MKPYKPEKVGKRVIGFLEDHGKWCSVKDVYGVLGIRRNGVRYILNRLVDSGMAERREYVPPEIVYPENWEEWGEYARRGWRKRNDVKPYRFQRKYEYRLRRDDE